MSKRSLYTLIMQVSDFNFELPEELIAKYPCNQRDQSQLLSYSKSLDQIEHKKFSDIVDLVNEGDILVRNNSKVLPARFYIKNKAGANIEILLLKRIIDSKWQVLAKPGKKIKESEENFSTETGQKLKAHREGDEFFLDFISPSNEKLVINNCGEMPIPPYMKRNAEELDKERYQTTYAKESQSGSSVAAPTAGLHFTPELDQKLRDKGVEIIELSLHVGIGTFAPIKEEEIKKHKMHHESYEISEENWQKIIDAKKRSQRIITVGSTSTRVLESVALNNKLKGQTDIFIYPGFEFKITNAMITNFHLPKSSLIIMIAAFLGRENVQKIYKEAIEKKYNFYSYGDACFFST